jgi:hypothetical protein
MAATCVAPEVERPVENKTSQVRQSEPKPKHPFQDVMIEIFRGHDEFLGCTPD